MEEETTQAVDKRLPTNRLIEFWQEKYDDKGFLNPSTQAFVKDTIRALQELEQIKGAQ